MELTKRQAEVLKAITGFWQEHGYSPTVRELSEAIGNSSPQGTAVLLKCLEAKGYITRQSAQPRTIRVLRLPSDHANGGPTDEPPKPGIYENVPFEDYLAWDAVSNSRISLALRSLAHYRAGYTKEPTPAMRLGSLTHCGVLEPLAIAQRYAVMPAFEQDTENQTKDGKPTQSKATNYYRDKAAQFAEANRNKEIITQAVYDNLVGLVRSLASNERAMEFLGGEGPVEVSVVWKDSTTGLLCKARIDKWQRDKKRFCDLKTCRDPLKFNRTIGEYGYHRQAVFYQMGLHAVLKDIRLYQSPHLVAIEPAEPWGCRAAPVHDEWLVIGREEVNRALRLIAEAKEQDAWPGYDSPDHWLPPGWYGAKESSDDPIELSVGSEILAV